MARLASADPSHRISERESITAHIQDLLNASPGGCSSACGPDMLAVVDLVHDYPRALLTLQRSIRETIRVNEPRLDQIHVRASLSPDRTRIYIEIRARLQTSPRESIYLQSELDPTGRIFVS